MKDWYYIKILVGGILLGIVVLMIIYAIASYFTQGKVSLVPKIEYRDRTVYANQQCPPPSPPLSPTPLATTVIQRPPIAQKTETFVQPVQEKNLVESNSVVVVTAPDPLPEVVVEFKLPVRQ